MNESKRRFGGLNTVPGFDGWHYGLFIRHADGTRSFDLYGPDGEHIELDHVVYGETAKRAGEAIERSFTAEAGSDG